jgi:hypothetical protein
MMEAAKELMNPESNTLEDEAEDASSEDDSGADDEAGWEDMEDDDMPAASPQKKSKKKNGFSAIDKVNCQQPVLFIIGHLHTCSSTPLLLTFCDRKSSVKRFAALFVSYASQRTVTLSLSEA